MSGRLCTLAEAAELASADRPLLIAGDKDLLDRLPAGTWIGGTIPYFMTVDGGEIRKDRVFVDQLPEQVVEAKITHYATDALAGIPGDAYDNGFTVVIVPSGSTAHLAYAQHAPEFPGLFDQPVVGWVSGTDLDDLATAHPLVYAGSGSASATDGAVVLHARLADGVLAQTEILNLFNQSDGPALTFDETGFRQATVRVDGEPRSFAAYLREIGHDPRLPLVADYFGAPINVSFESIPDDDSAVTLYAPTFPGAAYRLAAPVDDYVARFTEQLPVGQTSPAFACNCILNYLYSDLEGRRTGDIVGPITFGEIAYELLNQTMVYVTLFE